MWNILFHGSSITDSEKCTFLVLTTSTQPCHLNPFTPMRYLERSTKIARQLQHPEYFLKITRRRKVHLFLLLTPEVTLKVTQIIDRDKNVP